MTLKPGLGVIQGHRNRHWLIRRIWLPIDIPRQPRVYLVYRFRDKQRFQSKFANFSHSRIFCPRWRGSPSNWVLAQGVKKTRMMALSGRRERSLTILLNVGSQIAAHASSGMTPGPSFYSWIWGQTGSVLSPFLFALYLDNLSNLMSSITGIVLYVEDILLVAPSASGKLINYWNLPNAN